MIGRYIDAPTYGIHSLTPDELPFLTKEPVDKNYGGIWMGCAIH
jgi:hypothetical protein